LGYYCPGAVWFFSYKFDIRPVFCLVAAGVALFLPIFIWGIFDVSLLRRKEEASFLIVIFIAVSSLYPLSKNIRIFLEAAKTVLSVKNQVMAISSAGGGGVVYLDNLNYLYKNIFFYAFNSSMFGPPFQMEKRDVFLLSSLSNKEKLFLLQGSDNSMILAWDAKEMLVKKLDKGDFFGLNGEGDRIEIDYPQNGVIFYSDGAFMSFKVEAYTKLKLLC